MAKFHSSIVLRFMDSQSEFASHCRTASEHHPTSACVVLRVDRSAQGKTGHPLPSFPTPSFSLPPVYYYSTSTSDLLERSLSVVS